MFRSVVFFLAAILLTSCDLQQLIMPEGAKTVAEYKNPHTLCESCHATEKPEPGGVLFSPGIDPSSLCLNCHTDYIQNHHPVNFAPANPSSFPFPLFGGEVKCLTCHQIHGGPNHEGTLRLLRGGPYPDRRMICFKCHSREKYASFNPHKMLDNKGNIRIVKGRPVCLWCHSKMPDPAVDRTNDVRFRADVGFLCWRCHPPMPGVFFQQHFLVTPSAKTMKIMEETEARLLVILPLVPRNRITCSTCHNPHQKGVMQHEAAAKGADAIDRLRLPSSCFGCHRT
jgi:predicted CXXCH cytochrome family protein